ncbi:hypothetical protein GAY28_24675 [Azospirillum brasilense]|nr:hypothetical protein [Azospirillum brasilense]
MTASRAASALCSPAAPGHAIRWRSSLPGSATPLAFAPPHRVGKSNHGLPTLGIPFSESAAPLAGITRRRIEPAVVIAWSTWRRCHQALANEAHRRTAQL